MALFDGFTPPSRRTQCYPVSRRPKTRLDHLSRRCIFARSDPIHGVEITKLTQ